MARESTHLLGEYQLVKEVDNKAHVEEKPAYAGLTSASENSKRVAKTLHSLGTDYSQGRQLVARLTFPSLLPN